MKIAIVDDLKEDRDTLADQVVAVCKTLQIPCDVYCFTDGNAFLRKFTPGAYDIVFLDIYMEELDGLETARSIRKSDQQVRLVFVTITDQGALQGYQVRASHYLVKPATPDAMEAALRACLARKTLDERFVTVKSGYSTYDVLLSNILYTSKGRNTVVLHTTRGDITVYTSFVKFSPQLLRDARFVQCNYGVLLNMEHVNRMDSKGFILDGGAQVHVSRRERERIRSAWVSFEAMMQKERWV